MHKKPFRHLLCFITIKPNLNLQQPPKLSLNRIFEFIWNICHLIILAPSCRGLAPPKNGMLTEFGTSIVYPSCKRGFYPARPFPFFYTCKKENWQEFLSLRIITKVPDCICKSNLYHIWSNFIFMNLRLLLLLSKSFVRILQYCILRNIRPCLHR